MTSLNPDAEASKEVEKPDSDIDALVDAVSG
jgi:hypothetical protein